MVSAIPWEEGEDYIRSGHRSPDDFQEDSFRTITIDAEKGIKAVIGKPKGKDTTEVQSYLFAKDKDWTVDKAKAWFEQHKENVKVKEHIQAILPFKVLEKIIDKPLKIRGVAMTAGISRNFNIYTPEELQAFANKLVSAPVYVEHVAVPNAVGKVTKTEWDGENLWYEAEIFEGDVADQIRKGLIQHVSVGADYEILDIVDGKVPHGLHNAELSLVAVPGIPETNVQILESLQRAKEQQEICIFCGKNPVEFWLGCCSGCFEKLPIAESKRQELRKMKEQQGLEPIIAGEYYLGFVQDPTLFMPEHFRTVWIDQPNGVLAVMAKTRADPAQERCQSILFLKSKWQPNTVQDWLTIHPDYVAPASVSASQNTPRGIEKMKEEDLKKLVDQQVKKALKEQGEPPKAGEPKTDKQRFMAHFGVDEEAFNKLYAVLGDELFKLLPERGQKVSEQEQNVDEIKAKITQLAQRRAKISSQLYPEPEQSKLTPEQRVQLEAEQEVIWAEIGALEKALAELIAGQVGATLGEGYAVNLEVKLKEAEWDTEYINDLPDSAFAVIGEGGEKDEQGKTVPRSLRHLPHHNAQGNLDLSHLRAALARLNQIEPASLQPEAKKHLCAHARSEKAEDFVSEFCGEEPPKTQEKSPCEKAKESLSAKVKELEEEVAKLKANIPNIAESLVKNPPKTMPMEETLKILEGLLPSPAVERSTMSMQRECQAIRGEVFKLRERLKSG